jgi:hypothetical protein
MGDFPLGFNFLGPAERLRWAKELPPLPLPLPPLPLPPLPLPPLPLPPLPLPPLPLPPLPLDPLPLPPPPLQLHPLPLAMEEEAEVQEEERPVPFTLDACGYEWPPGAGPLPPPGAAGPISRRSPGPHIHIQAEMSILFI